MDSGCVIQSLITFLYLNNVFCINLQTQYNCMQYIFIGTSRDNPSVLYHLLLYKIYVHSAVVKQCCLTHLGR